MAQSNDTFRKRLTDCWNVRKTPSVSPNLCGSRARNQAENSLLAKALTLSYLNWDEIEAPMGSINRNATMGASVIELGSSPSDSEIFSCRVERTERPRGQEMSASTLSVSSSSLTIAS